MCGLWGQVISTIHSHGSMDGSNRTIIIYLLKLFLPDDIYDGIDLNMCIMEWKMVKEVNWEKAAEIF